MPTAIQFLRTSTENLRPNPSDLSEGMPMVGLHETDPGLYFKLRNDDLCKIGPCSVSPFAPNSSPVLQTGNTIGEFWLDTSATPSLLKVWDGTQWESTGGGGGGGIPSALTSGNLFVGDSSNVATDTAISGDVTLSDSGVIDIIDDVNLGGSPTVATQAAGTNNTTIATTAYTDAAAAAAVSSLPLTNSEIYIGNALNVAASVALSGDATIANTGSLTIANDAITTVKILDASVTGSKIEDNVALSGNPTVTTQPPGTSNTTIATTAYTDAAVAGVSSPWEINSGEISPVTDAQNIVPASDGGASVGTALLRWSGIYTQDMHFNNTGTSGNEVDGTTGHWTVQEGADSLYIINRITGGKFRISMEPVD